MITGYDGQNDYLIGTAEDDIFLLTTGFDTIEGGEGSDTLIINQDLTESTEDSIHYNIGSNTVINCLSAGGGDYDSYNTILSSVNYHYVIFLGSFGWTAATSIEEFQVNLIGTPNNDLLIYQNGTLYYGGAGEDTFFANWSAAVDSIIWDNDPGTIQTINGVSVSGLERLLIATGSGNDVIINSKVNTHDYIYTGSGDDIINAGGGSDRLDGGAGNDIIDGGADYDFARYLEASSGVTVNLSLTEAQNTIGAGVDTLIGIESLIGSRFDDILTGNSDNNMIYGYDGNDTLNGDSGNDVLEGGNGNDILSGGAGYDQLDGGEGNDILNGGADRDKAFYNGLTSGVMVSLGITGPQNTISAGVDTLIDIEDLVGSPFDDILTGNSGDNYLSGDYGNDILDGGDGQDEIHGDEGQDALYGGDGNDYLYGGDGQDILCGGAGNDVLDGGSGFEYGYDVDFDGANYIDAWSGVTVDMNIIGPQNTIGAGIDTLIDIEYLIGSDYDDTLTGDGNNNSLLGSVGNDSLFGNAGNDGMGGSLGNDNLNGGDGDDWLNGGEGDDIIDGGAGSDTAQYLGSLSGVTVNLSLEGVQNTASAGMDILIGIENLEGGEYDDTLTGDSNNNVIDGYSGNDILDGGAGNDILIGNCGNDTYVFGRHYGQDLIENYSFSEDIDTISISDISPSDIILSRIGNDLVISIKNLTDTITVKNHFTTDAIDRISFFDGTVWNADDLKSQMATFLTEGDDNYTGTEGDDKIDGLGGNDIIHGLGGNDEIFGGAGFDKLDGGDGNDSLYGGDGIDELIGWNGDDILNGGTNYDVALYSEAGSGVIVNLNLTEAQNTIGAGVDTLIDIENLSGSSYDDTLTGNSDSNILVGGVGDDSMYGGAGDDFIDGGEGNDTLNGNDGNDNLIGRDGNDILNGGTGYDGASYFDAGLGVTVNISLTWPQNTIGAGIDTLIDIEGLAGSRYNDSLTGNEDQNYLYGFDGDDTLNGGDNTDFIVGDPGNDILIGGAGDDFLEGGPGNDTAQYLEASSGVTVNLSLYGSHQNTIGAGSDVLFDIENLFGSSYDDYLTGDNTNNILDGYYGNDTLNGGGGDDILNGGDGADILTGDQGDDLLDGGDGDDTILGSNGNDRLFGGTGFDNLSIDISQFPTSSSMYYLVTPQDEQSIFLSCSSSFDSIINAVALSDANRILVTENFGSMTWSSIESLNLTAGSSEDLLIFEGAGGNYNGGAQQNYDTFYADWSNSTSGITWENNPTQNQTITGVDVSVSGLERLLLTTGAGDDVLSNTKVSTDDVFITGPGNDTINAGAGNDRIEAGYGDDTVTAIGGSINGGDGFDALTIDVLQFSPFIRFYYWLATQDGQSILLAYDSSFDSIRNTLALSGTPKTMSSYNDEHISWKNIERLNLTAGFSEDLLIFEGTGGSYNGGTQQGYDTFYADWSNTTSNIIWGNDPALNQIVTGVDVNVSNLERLLLTTGAGDDVISNTKVSTDDVFITGSGNDTISAGAGNDRIEAGDGNDTIYGADRDDYLFGGSGKDLLFGDAGNDILDGGAEADKMAGGLGDDTYYVDNARDIVTEDSNSGIDTVSSSFTFTLGSNFENLILTGTTAINGTGNALQNELIGNSGDNKLDGEAGADTMIGLKGNDIYIVDNAGDAVIEVSDSGIDTVSSSVNFTLGSNLENLILTGKTAINVTGNDLSNILTGNANDNIIDGGAGADNMAGGRGSDIYYVDNVGDIVTETSFQKSEKDTVCSSISYILGANVEDLTLLGSSAINGSGNELANYIKGNESTNTLNGGAGNDTIDGGFGDDILMGEAGNDTYLFRFGVDLISDSGGTDKLVFDSFTYEPSSIDIALYKSGADVLFDIGGGNQVMVAGQANMLTTVERFELPGGYYLTSADVNQVIQDMTSFADIHGIAMNSITDVTNSEDLMNIINLAWRNDGNISINQYFTPY